MPVVPTRRATDLLPVIRTAAAALTVAERQGLFLVAVSGGTDSLALLQLLHRWATVQGGQLHAVTVDHQLRPSSADDVRQVQAVCAAWQIPLTVCQVDRAALEAHAGGLEAGARLERYRLLAAVVAQLGATVVALGHQADDQAETVLLHLLRGAGLAGLRGMPTVRRAGSLLDQFLSNAEQRPALWRPLLAVRRQALAEYCRAWGITPATDPTNTDQVFRRNAVRASLLPAAEAIFPGAAAALARSADLFAAEDDLLDTLTTAAWDRCVRSVMPVLLLDRAAFRAEPLALQRRLLRYAWAVWQGTATPLDLSLTTLDAARAGIVTAGSGGRWTLPGDALLLAEDDQIAIGGAATLETLLRQQSGLPLVAPGWSAAVPDDVLLSLAPGWSLRTVASAAEHNGAAVCHLPVAVPAESLQLRTWQAGDYRLLPQGGRQALQDWLVNQHVPGYLRQHLVLLAQGQQIWWVVGLASFTATTTAVRALRLLYNDNFWQPAQFGEG